MNEADLFNKLIQTVIGHQNAIQALIVVLSTLALIGVTCKTRRLRFVGCVVGLISQIFWFLSAYGARQWGIILLVVIHTVFYARGVRNNMRKDIPNGESE